MIRIEQIIQPLCSCGIPLGMYQQRYEKKINDYYKASKGTTEIIDKKLLLECQIKARKDFGWTRVCCLNYISTAPSLTINDANFAAFTDESNYRKNENITP